MTLTNSEKRSLLIWCLLVTVYPITSIFVSVSMWSGMFTVLEDFYDDNRTLKVRNATTGYSFNIEISTCLYAKTGKNCSVSYEDYPTAMTFVNIACSWIVLISIFIMYFLLFHAAVAYCSKGRPIATLPGFVLQVSVCIVNGIGYLVYIYVIGKEVGFSWVNLTPAVYVGLVNACLGTLLPVCLFFLERKRSKENCKSVITRGVSQAAVTTVPENCKSVITRGVSQAAVTTVPESPTKQYGLVYVKYQKQKKKKKKAKKVGRETGRQKSFLTSSDFNLEADDEVRFLGEIKLYIQQVWKPQKVGIGRDARGLNHSSIHIITVLPVGNESVFQRYSKRKKQVEDFAASVGGKLDSPERYSWRVNPVQTTDLTEGCASLRKSLNSDINEYYLFHGTPIENLSSIERTGFDMEKCRFSMLGRGIYFTEDPVKADQYTGKTRSDRDRCMILCRVLLGDTVIQRHVEDPVVCSGSITPPCKECLKPNQACNCKDSTSFDSVIFEGKLFREFVVYDNSLTFPEIAVIYKRV